MKNYFLILLLLIFSQLSVFANDLICLELKYTVNSNVNHSVDKIEYFYLDKTNNTILDDNKNPVTSIEELNDKNIVFITKYPANDKAYNIVTTYKINRFTGGLKTIQQSCPRTKLAKFDRALTTGLYDITIGEGTGTVSKVDKALQKF